jgi:hypothetical protein
MLSLLSDQQLIDELLSAIRETEGAGSIGAKKLKVLKAIPKMAYGSSL